MQIITLTTDFGLKDHYAAALKGKLLSASPHVTIVDISHEITPFETTEAAFTIRNSYKAFPAGTVNLLCINGSESNDSKNLVILYDNQYFIGVDNGIFSLIFDRFPDKIYEINKGQFNGDILVNGAINLLNKTPFELYLTEVFSIKEKRTMQPMIQQSLIQGSIIHTDNYENLVTNISKQVYDKTGGGNNSFLLYFKRNENRISLSNHYHEVPEGEIVCLFDDTGYLQVAINKGKACSLLGLNKGDSIQIEFI